MASSNYNLYLETSKGLIYVPCGKIAEIDKFTMRFENRLVFLSVLIEMLKLDVSIQEIRNVYLSNAEPKYLKEKGFDYEKCLPIKYGCDNFKLDSLIGYFADYLKKDRKRLQNYKEAALGIIPYFDEGSYTDKDIEFFAKRYLETSYRRQRDEYFFLTDFLGYSIVTDSMPKGRHVERGIDNIKNKRKYFDLLQLAYFDYEKYERKLESFSDEEYMELAKCVLLLSATDSDRLEFEKISKYSIEELQQMFSQKTKRGRR